MSTCPATRLAWSIWVFSALFGATALVITFLGVSAGPSFLEFGAASNAAVIAASFSTVGAMVASRRPKNPIGWIMCAGGLGVVLGSLTDAYAIYVLFGSLNEPIPGATLSAWVSLWTTTAGIQSFALLLPGGRLSSRHWRPVVWLVDLVLAAESASSAFVSERFVGYGDISNPFHIAALAHSGTRTRLTYRHHYPCWRCSSLPSHWWHATGVRAESHSRVAR